MDRQEKCKCKKPILQPHTKQCGKCKLYIDRAKHILLTNPNVVKSFPQDTDGCSNDRNKCQCKDWGGCPVDYPF